MRKKQMFAMVVAAVMWAGSLAGCGGSDSDENTTAKQNATDEAESKKEEESAKSDSEKKKVVLWTWASGRFDLAQETYFKTHPDADWEFEEVVVPAEDYLTKLQQSYASGGDMPDILMAEMGWRASAFSLDIWEKLEEEPYNFDRSVLFDNVIGQITNKDDQILGIENAVNPAFIMYKRDLAEEYLGTSDQKELEAMFQTYDDYIEVGKEVYEKSGGTVHLFPGLQDVANMMYQQKRDQNNVGDNGNLNVLGKVTPVFETLQKMKENNVCGDLIMYSTEWNNAFAGSDTIFFPGASWSVTSWVEPYDPEGSQKGNWEMFTPAEGGFSWGGTCYGIYKNSEMKEEAWDFISWVLLTKEGAQTMKEGSGFFLPVKSLYEDPEYTAGTRQSFGEQEINKFMTEEIAPNIADASLSVYDSLVEDSVNMVAEMMGADDSLTADKALEEFKSDLGAKVPELKIE